MKPNSGKYCIKMRLDKFPSYSSNIIGIISQNYSKKYQDSSNNVDWKTEFYDYIGWSASPPGMGVYVPNGLYCGTINTINGDNSSMENNIFRVNKFIYKSNNDNYNSSLPPLKANDTIVLSYDSNVGILSFGKTDDNGKLDAQISNLPKMKTFYWFVARGWGRVSLTIVD